jgi:hypothetical protein
MPLSRQQYVFGIIAAMRAAHGLHAHAVTTKRAAEYRRSGNGALADVWAEASRKMERNDGKHSHLADLGYIPEDEGLRDS